MAQMLIMDNAIGWAQLRLRGGWRNLLTIAGVMGGIAVLCMVLCPRIFDIRAAYFDEATINISLGLQMLLWLLAIPNRVSTAVRDDLTSRMIESHRMMPITSAEAVIGYLLGPSSIMLAVLAVAVLTGLWATFESGIAIERYLIACALIASQGLVLTIFCLAISFHSRVRAGVLLLIAVPILFALQQALSALPGMMVLNGPFMRQTVFSMRASAYDLRPYAICEAAQFLIGCLYFLAATRRYRRPELPGFTPLMGLCLLVIWLGLSWVGISYFELFSRYGSEAFDRMDAPTQWVSSCVAGMLLAMLPLGACIGEENRRASRRKLNLPPGEPRLIPSLLMVLLAAVAISAIPAICLTPVPGPIRLSEGFLIILMFLLQMYFVLRVTSRRRAGAALASAWIVGIFLVPVLVGLVVSSQIPGNSSLDRGLPGSICFASPVGALAQIWCGGLSNPSVGIAVQGGLVVLAFALTTRFGRRRQNPPKPAAD
jgi:hypothetical protein